MAANVLYVVFHGLVCLVDGKLKSGVDQGFRAYVLLDKDNTHKIMFGDFLAEQDFSGSGTLNLIFNGLTAGTDPSVQLDRGQNPVVDLADFPAATPDVRAVITLPRPNQIFNLFRGDIKPGSLSDPNGHMSHPPSQISAVRIFVYNFADPNKVFLSDNQGNAIWNCPDLAEVDDLNVAVFHLYDEPPRTLTNPTPDNHNVREFNDSMEFLQAHGASIAAAAKVNKSTVDPNSNDTPGILDVEIAALDTRNQKRIMGFIKGLREATGTELGGGGGTQVCGGGNGSLP